MHTWISSETWLLLAIVSLIIFFTRGIDYSKPWFSERNIGIMLLIPISILQLVISSFDVFFIFDDFKEKLTNILNVYGVFFFGYIFLKI